jgi:integrase
MKNYSTTIAAYALVKKRVRLGVSRHQCKQDGIDNIITGFGTARTHTSALKVVGDWLYSAHGKFLKNLNETDAAEYLCMRALTVSQKTLDLDRQAINFHLLYQDPVPFILSTIQTKLTNRAYTKAQIKLMREVANPKMLLSIDIALAAGLRAVELVTISLPEFLPESLRSAWSGKRFIGREEETSFVVNGKGGLRREVRLPKYLALQIMNYVRPHPVKVTDRKADHTSYFDLTCGVNFSQQFTNLSNKVLGMSNGAHGLRHTFAQRRLRDLMCNGLSFEDALHVLSNELGHFSTSNTFAYLRD